MTTHYKQSFLISQFLLLAPLLLARHTTQRILNPNSASGNTSATPDTQSIQTRITPNQTQKENYKPFSKPVSKKDNSHSEVLEPKTQNLSPDLGNSKLADLKTISFNQTPKNEPTPKTITEINSQQYTLNQIKTIFSKSIIYKQKIQKGEIKVNSENYFKANLDFFDCEHHIRFMQLNFACMEELNDEFLVPYQKRLFIVESNFQKYFLLMGQNIERYELAIEKSLKLNGVILNLLQHKIIDGRFAGIYRFEENLGLLDTNIKTNALSVFDKLSLMLRFSKAIRRILQYRDLKNESLIINLDPKNILLTSQHKYSFKLISPLPNNILERINFLTPERLSHVSFADKKTENVYTLGKLFFYMIFRVFPSGHNDELVTDLDKFILKYKKKKKIGFFNTHSEDAVANLDNEILKQEEQEVSSECSTEEPFIGPLPRISSRIQTFQGMQLEFEQIKLRDLQMEDDIIETVDIRLISMIRMMLNRNPVDRPSLLSIIALLEDLRTQNQFLWDRVSSEINQIYNSMKVELKMEEFQFRSNSLNSNAKLSAELEKKMIKEFKKLPKLSSQDLRLFDNQNLKRKLFSLTLKKGTSNDL